MRSAKTFNGSGWRRLRHENGTVTARAPRGGAATGGLAARTRILAIASRRRIVLSAPGLIRIRRRVTKDTAIGPGGTNRRALRMRNRTIEDRGPANPRPPTIGRGRRNRRGRERSGSRGPARRPAVRAGLANPQAALEVIDRGGPSRAP